MSEFIEIHEFSSVKNIGKLWPKFCQICKNELTNEIMADFIHLNSEINPNSATNVL